MFSLFYSNHNSNHNKEVLQIFHSLLMQISNNDSLLQNLKIRTGKVPKPTLSQIYVWIKHIAYIQ